MKQSTHKTLQDWATKLATVSKQHALVKNLQIALPFLKAINKGATENDNVIAYQSIIEKCNKRASSNIIFRIYFNISITSYELEKTCAVLNKIYERLVQFMKIEASRPIEASASDSPHQDCAEQKTSELSFDKQEHKKAALEIHPDRYQGEEDKAVADKLFKYYLSLYAQKSPK